MLTLHARTMRMHHRRFRASSLFPKCVKNDPFFPPDKLSQAYPVKISSRCLKATRTYFCFHGEPSVNFPRVAVPDLRSLFHVYLNMRHYVRYCFPCPRIRTMAQMFFQVNQYVCTLLDRRWCHYDQMLPFHTISIPLHYHSSGRGRVQNVFFVL